MPWLGRDLNDYLVPNAPPWTGSPSTTLGCSKPHPKWPGTLPEMGNQ